MKHRGIETETKYETFVTKDKLVSARKKGQILHVFDKISRKFKKKLPEKNTQNGHKEFKNHTKSTRNNTKKRQPTP